MLAVFALSLTGCKYFQEKSTEEAVAVEVVTEDYNELTTEAEFNDDDIDEVVETVDSINTVE